MPTKSLPVVGRSVLVALLLGIVVSFWGLAAPEAPGEDTTAPSSPPVYGAVITEAGKRVEFDADDFLWWAELDEEVQLQVDGKNFAWIERSGPVELRGEKKDQRLIPAVGHTRGGADLPLRLPESMSSITSRLKPDVLAFRRIEFTSDTPMGNRPDGPLQADVVTESQRKFHLTAVTPDTANQLELPLGFTWEKMMERPVSKRVFMIKSDCTEVAVEYSKFHIDLLPLFIRHAEKQDSRWVFQLQPADSEMTATAFPNLCGYTDQGWARLTGKRVVRADFSGAAEPKVIRKAGDEPPGPTAVLTDVDGKTLRVDDLRLRRVTYSGSGWNEKMEISRLPNIVVTRLSDQQSQTIEFAEVKRITVADRAEPLKLSIQLKNATTLDATCASYRGEFEVLTLSGFSKYGDVEILLADTREIEIVQPVKGPKTTR
jgi:hypothetical protein